MTRLTGSSPGGELDGPAPLDSAHSKVHRPRSWGLCSSQNRLAWWQAGLDHRGLRPNHRCCRPQAPAIDQRFCMVLPLPMGLLEINPSFQVIALASSFAKMARQASRPAWRQVPKQVLDSPLLTHTAPRAQTLRQPAKRMHRKSRRLGGGTGSQQAAQTCTAPWIGLALPRWEFISSFL